jgi:hypothetical protein
MPQEDRKQTGVSWNDVWNWCADLEKCWHCYVEFKQWRVRKEGHYGKWDVRITCSWLGVGGVVTRTESLSVAYPNNTSKTLPGAQMWLLIEMDKKLEELAREQRSGAVKQSRFA